MERLTNISLFREYFDKVKKKYPNLEWEEFKKIVERPWKTLNANMKKEDLPPTRLKYFGTFLTKEGRVRFLLRNLDDKFKRGDLTEERFISQRKTYKTYLKMKYEGLLEQFNFEIKDYHLEGYEMLLFYEKGNCQIVIDQVKNTFIVTQPGTIPKESSLLFWFKSYDLLKEILKKV